MLDIQGLIILLAVVALLGCNDTSSSNDDERINTSSTLDYFGFALVDCGWDDPNDNTVKTNYVDEVSGFSNVAQMCVFAPDELIANRVGIFHRAGIKAVLNVEALLFGRTEDANSPSGYKLALRQNAEALWDIFVSLNREVLVPKYIAAFYVVDEPLWNSVSEADFVRALQIVKATYPALPTFSIEAHPVVDRMMVPEMLDWVGFDRYFPGNPGEDPVWLGHLEKVRGALTHPDQRIVIVASTQWLPSYQNETGVSPEDMEAIIYSYYRIAASDPDVVALAGYMWPSGFDHPAQLGARNLPDNVQKVLRKIGSEILDSAVLISSSNRY